MDTNKQAFFSIVMAVYNVEKYLEEALESLLKQTFSFDNIEVILVNDGSTDNSAKICETYASKYQNIIYLSKENGGVSSARNAGIDMATGKYINFMDPDDRLDKKCLEVVHRFFINNPEVKIATIPFYMFEAQNGSHILNFKFKDERVVDSQEEFNSIFLSSSISFINRDTLGTRRFTLGRKYGEDAELMTELVVENRYFGLIPEAKYFYRKRYETTSALNFANDDPDYFIPYFQYLKGILEKHTVNGITNKYVQEVVFYDMAWKLEKKDMPLFLEDKIDEFKDIIFDMLSYIDREIIIGSRVLNHYQKHAVLSWKATGLIPTPESGFYKELKEKNNLFLEKDNGEKGFALSRIELKIDVIDFQNNIFTIIGYYDGLYSSMDLSFYILDNNKERFSSKLVEYNNNDVYFLGALLHKRIGFIFSIEYEKIEKMNFFNIVVTKKGLTKITSLDLKGNFSKITKHNMNSYIVANDSLLFYNREKKSIMLTEKSKSSIFKREARLLEILLRINKRSNGISKREIHYVSTLRIKARSIQRKNMQKNKIINLFIDRVDKADDNAEVLYDFFAKESGPNMENYFIINKTSPDYIRLIEKGVNVVAFGSREHCLLLLTCNYLFSSHADHMIFNTPKFNRLLLDIKQFKYVFLQHGVTKDDMSHWLKRSNQNFYKFITSSKYEYNDIVNNNYQYTPEQISLTGFPRFDNLTNTKAKTILIMPTWRHDIVGRYDHNLRQIPYVEKFKHSYYFKCWNSFLNNNDFLNFCNAKGYKIMFVPHPSIRQQITDFNLSNVIVSNYKDRYVDLFNSSSILITDYSSTFFDFGYTYKPVIYYHFDTGNWDRKNSYFSYEENGFGPIYSKQTDILDYVKKLIENDCEMEEKYRDRVATFYNYHDTNNSKRIYDMIINDISNG